MSTRWWWSSTSRCLSASRSWSHALGVDLLNADRDPLTGLLNRRAFFFERAGQLVVTQGFAGAHLVVAMIDLDRFKLLNDTEGHAAGDRS